MVTYLKAAERWVKLILYPNSRQWHWSEERHLVGEDGRPKRCNATHQQIQLYSYRGKMLKQMTPERSVNTSFQCSQPLFFSPLVTVNNLGLRRFIALHSKCSRRICVLWPSYWSNWEDVQQSKRNSWEPHRMHGIRKGIRALISLWQGHSSCFEKPGGG